MKQERSGKSRRAYDFILAAMKNGDFDESGRLPSCKSIARRIGVSNFTVWQAVRALRAEGSLTGAPGHRATLPGSLLVTPVRPAVPQADDRRAKHRTLQMRIRRDILNDFYPHRTPLPSCKELAARYGASPMTLRKTLRSLIEDGVVEHRGVRFFPVSISASPGSFRSRIVLLGYGRVFESITWTYWHHECLKLLELECAKAGIGLDAVFFRRESTGLEFFDARTGEQCALAKNPEAIGYVYTVTGTECAEDALFQSVVAWGMPVAVFDEVGAWPSLRFIKSHPNIRVFRNTVSTIPVQHVAQFVLELGHRSAVYISPHHRWEYSIRRCEGLVRSMACVDNARCVPITSEFGASDLLGAAKKHQERADTFYADWRRDLTLAYTSLLDRYFEHLHGVLIWQGQLHEHLERLFARALEIPDATIWIMVNDECAKYAIDYLSHKGVAVPGDLSIISFDDIPKAFEAGISSYNFNFPGVSLAMLRYITNPCLFPSSKPIVEIEGWIIPRRTTGRPPALAGSSEHRSSNRLVKTIAVQAEWS